MAISSNSVIITNYRSALDVFNSLGRPTFHSDINLGAKVCGGPKRGLPENTIGRLLSHHQVETSLEDGVGPRAA